MEPVQVWCIWCLSIITNHIHAIIFPKTTLQMKGCSGISIYLNYIPKQRDPLVKFVTQEIIVTRNVWVKSQTLNLMLKPDQNPPKNLISCKMVKWAVKLTKGVDWGVAVPSRQLAKACFQGRATGQMHRRGSPKRRKCR